MLILSRIQQIIFLLTHQEASEQESSRRMELWTRSTIVCGIAATSKHAMLLSWSNVPAFPYIVHLEIYANHVWPGLRPITPWSLF